MSERIGLVCPYSFDVPGGVQNHVLGLAGWLKRQGHTVGIHGPGQLTAAQLARHGLVETEFSSAGKSFPLKANGSVARINFGREAANSAKKWLAQTEWSLIHVHEPLLPSSSLLTLSHAKVPVIATFHTSMPVKRLFSTANQFLPQFSARIDASIAVSKLAAEVAKAHAGCQPVVIGNGLHIDDYPQAATTTTKWRGGDHPRVTFVGRYDEPRKGFRVLTSALPMLRAAVPDLAVVVIGDGSNLSVDGVQFVGRVDDQTRNQWLSASDVYIAPQTGRESFGIVLLEALACGTPVVASDLSAFEEVLTDRDGVVGHLFENKNSTSLANAVLSSLQEPRDLRLQRGIQRAANFDWRTLGPQILAQYKLGARNFADRPNQTLTSGSATRTVRGRSISQLLAGLSK